MQKTMNGSLKSQDLLEISHQSEVLERFCLFSSFLASLSQNVLALTSQSKLKCRRDPGNIHNPKQSFWFIEIPNTGSKSSLRICISDKLPCDTTSGGIPNPSLISKRLERRTDFYLLVLFFFQLLDWLFETAICISQIWSNADNFICFNQMSNWSVVNILHCSRDSNRSLSIKIYSQLPELYAIVVVGKYYGRILTEK